MSDLVKVCHVASGDLWGGAEAMVTSLVKGLQKYNNIELSVILLNEGKLAEEIRKLNINVFVLMERDMNIMQLKNRISEIIKKKSPDFLHSHGYKENLLSYLSTRKNKSVQLIATQHGIPEVYDKNIRLKYRIGNKLNFVILALYFRHVIAVSEDIKSILNYKYNLKKNQVKVIYNGIGTCLDFKKKKNDNLFIIGSIGRLSPVKNYSLMVEIAKEIKKNNEKIHFELAGEGSEKEKINELIKKYRLENMFTLRGFINSPPDFYSHLDLYINTSLHEGLPMGVLEAMAHGIPVIASNVGGFKEIIKNGIHGYLVEGRDPKEFKEKILFLYQNNLTRENMGVAARDRVIQNFSIESMVSQYHNLYT